MSPLSSAFILITFLVLLSFLSVHGYAFSPWSAQYFGSDMFDAFRRIFETRPTKGQLILEASRRLPPECLIAPGQATRAVIYGKFKRLTPLGTRGCAVSGFPSTGGKFEMYPSKAQLDYIFPNGEWLRMVKDEGLSYASGNASEEDAHCERMKKCGANWEPSSNVWGEQIPYEKFGRWRPIPEGLELGWPSDGGVWVLKDMSPEQEQTLWILNMEHGEAQTMKEWCQRLETVGATYYANPHECEDTKCLVEPDNTTDPLDHSDYKTFHLPRLWYWRFSTEITTPSGKRDLEKLMPNGEWVRHIRPQFRFPGQIGPEY